MSGVWGEGVCCLAQQESSAPLQVGEVQLAFNREEWATSVNPEGSEESGNPHFLDIPITYLKALAQPTCWGQEHNLLWNSVPFIPKP